MKKLMLLIFIIDCIFSCKSIDSHQSGVLQNTKEGIYYFKIFDYDDFKKLEEQGFIYTDLWVGNKRGKLNNDLCVICRLKCRNDSFDEINMDTLSKLCDQDPKYMNCNDVGFNEKDKIFNQYKDALSSDMVIKNQEGYIDLYNYFEKINEIFDHEYTDDFGQSVCVLSSDKIMLYDETWESIVADEIYKLQAGSDYYHATDGKLYSNQEEALEVCKNLKDENLKWELISSEEFDLVNKKNMAKSIRSRMNLGRHQCFYTSNNEKKAFSDTKDCTNETQGRVLCVAHR